MNQLGDGHQEIWIEAGERKDYEPSGIRLSTLARILVARTAHLDKVLPCEETRSALWYLKEAARLLDLIEAHKDRQTFHVCNEGHTYVVHDAFGCPHRITFIKRSGGAIRYRKESPGIQSQELLRVMIAVLGAWGRGLAERRALAIDDLRKVIYFYEARALRRKTGAVNRTSVSHDSSERLRAWRSCPFEDVPFDHEEIERRPVGPDGHIVLTEEEAEWLAVYHLSRIATTAA